MTIANTVEKIRKFYKDELPTRIPFDTHPLKDASEYAKELYCTMLAVIVQYENEPMREQLIFLERIVKGVGLETSIQNLMQKAKTVDEKFAKDFYEEFVDQPLAKNFVVDALVMTNAREKVNGKQMEFLVEVVDVLGIEEKEFERLVQEVQQILNTPINNIKSLYTILDYEFLYYIFKEKNVICLCNTTPEHFEKLLDELEHPSSIYVYDSKFDLEKNLVIEEPHNIFFINCEFTGDNCIEIYTNRNSVMFERCYFSDMKNSCIYVENSMALYIISSKFENCGNSSGGDIEGGVISNDDSELELYLIGNEFDQCYVRTSSSSFAYWAKGAIFSGRVSNFLALNNRFIDCRCYSKNSSKQLFYINEFREPDKYPELLNRFKEQLTGKKDFRQNPNKHNTFIGNNSSFY